MGERGVVSHLQSTVADSEWMAVELKANIHLHVVYEILHESVEGRGVNE